MASNRPSGDVRQNESIFVPATKFTTCPKNSVKSSC